MYQSSSSSSSPISSGHTEPTNNTVLMRNGSAPSSLIITAVDGVINRTPEFSSLGLNHKPQSRFFPSESSSLTSDSKGINVNTTIVLQRSYGLKHEGNLGMMPSLSPPPPAPPLVRHSSSPAGLLNQLAHASAASNDDNGFLVTRNGHLSRLNFEHRFTRSQAPGQITEENHSVVNDLNRETDPDHYGFGSWSDPSSIMISMGANKRSSKNLNGDIVDGLNAMESQLQFRMQPAMPEVGSMEKLLNLPPDSIPCKIRAKRGFATHPRSIAERERRTRISGKLKKLQDLVPNMDKQTSYADMLDSAVQHIKCLQNQVQKLNKEVENCTCGCRKPWNGGKEESRKCWKLNLRIVGNQ